MRATFDRRLTLLTLVLVVVGGLMLARLASFQFQLDMAYYLEVNAQQIYRTVSDRYPERGRIYDRNRELLAANTTEYVIGASPIYINNKERAASLLAEALGESESRIFDLINNEARYVRLTAQPVSTEIAQKVGGLDLLGIVIDAEPRRIYPQGSLAAHLIGFVGWDSTTRRGYMGVEGAYNAELAGQSRVTEQSRIPFEVNPDNAPKPGDDIILTIDRRIQHLAEMELLDAINRYGATGGSVLIMDPRNGELLAMASYPTFDPNAYYKIDANLMRNPAISAVYEPGSVFKIVTASVALESGRVDENSTYFEGAACREVGGRCIYNWDRAAHGSQSFVDILVRSWNLGTTWLAVDILRPTDFYLGLRGFGVGQPTGIDLEGEAGGILRTPNDTTFGEWSDSDLATNS
ncbi:MAG: hypothetical protein IT323_07795, partial [Anaerolineae bacterium]|nr:hypothetical protein [Anaerolineae bacterium]